MNFRNSIVLPIITIILLLPLGIAVVTYTMHTTSLTRLESEREKEKTSSISFIIKAIFENEVKGIHSLSKTLQNNPEIAQDLAYYSMTGARHVFDEVLSRLGAVVDSDIFLLTDKEGNVVKSVNDEASDHYSVSGVKDVIKGESYLGMDDGPEGWAIRSFVPIYWPLGGELYGALVVGVKINYEFALNIATETNTQITITNTEGNILATCAPENFKQLLERQLAIRSIVEQRNILANSDLVNTTYLPIAIANGDYCLIVQQDVSQIRSIYKQEQQSFWVILSTIVGIVFFVMLWFVFYVIKPIKKLESKTQQMTIKFSGEFDETGGGHEIDRLVRSFDFMLDSLNEHTKKLAEAKDPAEKATRTKSEFLANMSHELRTPLNAILGFSELMMRDPLVTHDQLANLETIGRSGEHLLSLINDVLEFSKIEAGRIELNNEHFDLHRLLLGLEEMFRLRAKQKRLSLNFFRDPNVPHTICADQNKLRQVLINLLGNAVKFTETGGITLSVTKKEQIEQSQTDECHLSFEVIDTGIGISKEEQNKIFKAFFQADSQRSSLQGTGLGLLISQRFTALMGGVLTVNSKVSKGSSFIFDIPVGFTDDTASELLPFKQRIIGLEEGQTDFRILVVEDNENNRNLLVRLLKTVGFEVQEAVNGQDALDIWKKWNPHLIWMDLRMPVMDGYEATVQIKKTPVGKETVIIALTASAFEEDRLKVIQHGGNDFVRKPFKEAEIFEIMHKYLGVQFVYEKEDVDPKSKVCTKMDNVALISSIKNLPMEIATELKEATELSDASLIDQVIEEIQTKNDRLAEALSELANNFSYDKILEIIQKAQK